MQCPACGAYASAEDDFCGECGRPFVKDLAAVEPVAPDQVAEIQPDETDERLLLIPPASEPSTPPETATSSPATKSKASPMVLGLVLLGIGLALFCAFGVGLIAWLGSGDSENGILYEEDFSDPGSGWDTYDEADTSAGYVDGEYQVGVYDAYWVAWGNAELEDPLTDFVVELDARQVEGTLDNNFGVLVRYQPDGESFYWVQISGDGYYSADLSQGDEWATLVEWEESDAIKQGLGVTNRIKVKCIRETCEFWVNDTYLDSFTDGTLPSGDVGLAVGVFEEAGVIVRFDNLKVYKVKE